MKFAISATALSFSLLTGTTVADPVPQSCRVFCFRITDIRADKNDAELNRFHFEFEVLNWADSFAGGLTLALADISSEGVQFAPDTYFNFNGTDLDGRPLQLEDTNGDGVINANDLEDTNPTNGILDPGEDLNNNSRLDNDLMPGNLGRNNTWTLMEQTGTKMEWELGIPIPFINLIEADQIPSQNINQRCGACITALGNLPRSPGPVTVDADGTVIPEEAIDNGDNVQDGFVMTIDSLDVGKTVHINWFLLGAGDTPPQVFEDVPGMPPVCRTSQTPAVPLGDPIGVAGNQGNAYGFGLISLTRVDDGPTPGPVFVGNTGFLQTGREFFDSVYNVPDPAVFAMEFGAGLTAAYRNPNDSVGPVNAKVNVESCPLIPSCCEEDCCGKGTEWLSPLCVLNPASSGWQGEYSDEYGFGCCPRVCCEEDCCGDGTYYDPILGCCFPVS